MLAGDAWVGIAYNGDALVKLDDNTDFVLPAEGTIVWVDAMTVPAGTKHRESAFAFINFILDAEVGAALSNYLAYATPNQASLPLVDQEMRDDPRIYPSEAELASQRHAGGRGGGHHPLRPDLDAGEGRKIIREFLLTLRVK